MIVEEIWNWVKEEYFKHQREPGVVYVTDLVSCPKRREMELKYPIIASSHIYNPTAVQGQILHLGLEHLLKQRLKEVRTEVEVEREIFGVKLRGRMDAIIEAKGHRYGLELKTALRDTNLPHEHHILQCRIYNFLANLPYTVLLYITPDRICEYKVEGAISEEELEKLLNDDKAPRWDWECTRYCPFAKVCESKKSGR